MSEKSRFDQSELKEYVVSDCKTNYMLNLKVQMQKFKFIFSFAIITFRQYNSPANIRLDEDIFKTFWTCLSFLSPKDVFKTSAWRLDQDEYVCLSLTSSEDVFKTSSRSHQDLLPRRLQDVFKTSLRRLVKTTSRHLQDVFKRLQDVLQKRLQEIFKTSCKDIFKTFSRRIFKLNCSC